MGGTDSSDGLAAAVALLAAGAGCGAELERAALPIPQELAQLPQGEGWCLGGGEDFELVLALEPEGVFLSNGPGDPAETGKYAVPVIKSVIDSGTPTFGICLGHQMLGIALGGRTQKMHQGHHGANHPVKDMTTGKVEITSMNHGFAVDKDSLPKSVEQTHVSLFDGSNCGIAMKDLPVFSVQYHPEASPGPRDSHYLFTRFVDLMRARKSSATSRRQAG